MLAMMTPATAKEVLYPLQTFLAVLKVRLLAQALQVSLLVQAVQLAVHPEQVLPLLRK